jgi:hypothetical protein
MPSFILLRLIIIAVSASSLFLPSSFVVAAVATTTAVSFITKQDTPTQTTSILFIFFVSYVTQFEEQAPHYLLASSEGELVGEGGDTYLGTF